ncbi:PAS domain-containing sensor histidine kinase [Anaerovorax odorimutans]|uniref:histidine kinase n=1 Tax=Anaerovorax odorimutans TaxID=109327 RepID=A0ABT1RNX3_9FIRM|nr:PAS domain-containing sensor histidine kinase [Anaerovorax odorimutans]MCQ4636875.1 PAS domain-containing sensor histidine kinase [Anaerovorax odorimutans]
MYLIPSYSMLSATATTLVLSIIFLILSHQSGKTYMRLWGIAWLIYSAMFLLDFVNLQMKVFAIYYIMLRQLTAMAGAYVFLLGTHHFFQRKPWRGLTWTTLLSAVLILMYPFSNFLYTLTMIPNIIYCSGMLIISGCMFIAYSWTQNLPEKILASFFIIVWGIFINHFGFTLKHMVLAVPTYFIGLFTVNVLILFLIIIYFKKTRFLDTRQASRFRLLVENSSDSMFLYDYKKQEFEYVSPGISDLIGITDKQLYEMPDRFFDYVNTVKKSKDVVGIFSRPIARPGKGILCLYKNGSIEKWSEIHYLPIRDNTGTVSAIEGILRDITERKNMEENLRAAEKAKKEFLEDISHEIKTPVTLIQGYAESLLDKVVPVESTDTYLKMINAKAMMLTTLVDDLAQSSNFTSQSLEYRFYEKSAKETFEELLNQCEFQISQAGRKPIIEAAIASDAVLILDPYRIQQVVSNLINNSIRHTPMGKEIEVSCRTYLNEELLHSVPENDDYTIPEGELFFTVSDRGDGIPEKDLSSIFERNFSGGRKIDPGASRHPEKSQGLSSAPSRSGLGLFISKEIIKQHSGRMRAKNNQYGGAEISFVIPYYI